MEVNSNGQIVRVGKGAETVEKWLNANADQIRLAVPRGMDTHRLMRIFATEVQRVPKLVECTSVSLIGGFLQATQLGLEIGSALGQAYLIPFRAKGRMEATLIIGYKGLVNLAYRSRLVTDVTAEAVRQGDHFVYRLGTDPSIDHLKADDCEGKDLTHAYAIAWTPGAARPKCCVLTRSEIEKVKKSSRGAERSDSPWRAWEAQMWAKTALRRICKTLPQTPESAPLHTAIAIDELADANLPQEFDVDWASLPEVPSDGDGTKAGA